MRTSPRTIDHRRLRQDLEEIVAEQTKLLGPNHHETLETRTLLGVAHLLAAEETTSPGTKLLSDACVSSTSLFTFECPVLFTLCGLCWTFLSTSKEGEAERIFRTATELQSQHLGNNLALTTLSLEAPGKAFPTSAPLIQKALPLGINPYRTTGTLKCSTCRGRHRQVASLSFNS